MTAFTASNAGDNFFDAYTGGSVNATLDTYAISADSRLIVRTDTYCCPNHTVAFGSLDTVTFTGVGGTLRFDPTYVRVIAYTGGSGNSPAYGTTITAPNGTTGVFLGAWTTWQTEPIVAGVAIGATGYIKLGGVSVPGNFDAGALTGITATCSGPDVQGWIEIRGPDTATITVPRIGAIESVEAWFELGTTNGARGQIIPCPTTATVANVWPGVWIETAAGSGGSTPSEIWSYSNRSLTSNPAYNGPSVAQIRAEMDSNSVKLAQIKALIESMDIPTTAENAAAVWSTPIVTQTDKTTIGGYIRKTLLSIPAFLGLK